MSYIGNGYHKRLIFYPVLIIGGLHIFGFGAYAYNKTIGYSKTGCMIDYVNNYYPNGSQYILDGNKLHIDKRGLEYLDNEKEINGCFMTTSVYSFIINTPYCYITLFSEKILNII